MGQALLCILDFLGSLYASRNILAPAVKDLILMAQDYTLRGEVTNRGMLQIGGDIKMTVSK